MFQFIFHSSYQLHEKNLQTVKKFIPNGNLNHNGIELILMFILAAPTNLLALVGINIILRPGSTITVFFPYER